ncbi:MAG: hypothetical protein A2W99_16090 [Bacteroidetes bacterium GWF2_33_16]|nr:MAG: hypothetical protein A2X00_15435 [Bacteroidetes bacterium GWE2_32_14]OFY02422.1 MAG: hypothetical protein A2W99_16090 [Bacteroidetes bacterium GWF2_33_16]
MFGSCSSKRYLLTDSNKDKSFLVNKLKEEKSKGLISKKPIIVVDGVPYRFDYELKDSSLDISKSEIKKIEILEREIGIRIYGDFAKDGVVVITTNKQVDQSERKSEDKPKKSLEESKVLYLLGDKIITKKDLDSLDPDDIESIEVIKNKEAIKKYTSEDYDGVIIINLKK